VAASIEVALAGRTVDLRGLLAARNKDQFSTTLSTRYSYSFAPTNQNRLEPIVPLPPDWVPDRRSNINLGTPQMKVCPAISRVNKHIIIDG
jgi:hypothetical protein